MLNPERLNEHRFQESLYGAIGKVYKPSLPSLREQKNLWAETVVSERCKTLLVKVRIDYTGLKLNDVETLRLVNLAGEGIARYWSRPIVIDNSAFDVKVVVQPHTESASALPVLVRVEKGEGYKRSFNPGLLGIRARFIYNAGFFQEPGYAKSSFKLISAHEFGHFVLKAVGGIKLSWGHKGTTGVLSQRVKKSAPGYPLTGPIDLMRYYNDKKQNIPFSQLIDKTEATETDVLRLIWCSKLVWEP